MGSLLNNKIKYIIAVSLAFFSLQASADIINFSGQLDAILEDDGSAVYSGTPLGTTFTGSIDDVTANGQISNGTTTTTFTCCIAAGGLDISNNDTLDADEAALLNSLAGSAMFSAGEQIDTVNIEGDEDTASGGRIEVGLSFILKPSAFNNTDPSNYPFNPNDLLLSLFFILEEDAGNNDIYDVLGKLDTTTPPAQSSDLSIVKTDSADPVDTSGSFSYTLAVTNNGPTVATNVVVTDTLPTGMSFVSASTNVSGTSCSESSGVVTCDMENIANSGAVTATIEVTAPSTAGTISNTASVTADQADNNTANNSDSESTSINSSGGAGGSGGGSGSSSLSPVILFLFALVTLLRIRRNRALRLR